MTAVEEAAITLGTAPAPRASLYRARRPAAVVRSRPVSPRALDPVERQEVLDLLHTRFVDQAPAQMHAALLDEGTYLCAPRTIESVFWKSRSASAFVNRVVRRRFSCSSLFISGSTATAFRPRFFGVNPVVRCWRQVTRCEE